MLLTPKYLILSCNRKETHLRRPRNAVEKLEYVCSPHETDGRSGFHGEAIFFYFSKAVRGDRWRVSSILLQLTNNIFVQEKINFTF